MNAPKECELWTDGSDDYLILLICTNYATGDKNVVFHKLDYWQKRMFFYERYGTHEVDASYLDFLIETPQSLEMSLFTEKFKLSHDAPKEKHRGYHEVVGWNYKARINYF